MVVSCVPIPIRITCSLHPIEAVRKSAPMTAPSLFMYVAFLVFRSGARRGLAPSALRYPDPEAKLQGKVWIQSQRFPRQPRRPLSEYRPVREQRMEQAVEKP